MHIHRVIGGAAALAVGLSLASCASPGPDELRAEGAEPRSLAPADATALPDVTAAVRAFGLAVLSTAPKDANAVVSPASLASAFAMLAEGARGESSTQLDAVLGASGSDRSDAFAAIRSELAALDGDPAKATADELPERPILHLASRVVVDERIDPREEYLAALVETFDAGTQRTDLTVPGAKEVLSSWVRHHSGGLIQESAIRPNDLLRLVLQDVALLAARWDTPFRPDATSDDPFTLSDGSVVDVETMHTGAWFAYAEEQGWAAVRLPYTEAMHADIRKIETALLIPDGNSPAGTPPEDPAVQLLSSILTALQAVQSGQEALHQRLDTVARSISGASR